MSTKQEIREHLEAKWKNKYGVDREDLSLGLGGKPSKRGIANLDSKGLGPEGKYYNGGKVFYRTSCAIEWCVNRISSKLKKLF